MTDQEHTEEDPARTGEERPTPQLTTSQVKRMSQPMIGMIITMAVTVAAVAAFLLMNPEPDVEPYQRDEDVTAAAEDASGVTDYDPAAPDVPETWSANYARWETRPEHGVPVWEVGYTTAAVDFIGFAQTDDPNPTWIAEETEQASPSGTRTVEGLEFEVLDGEEERSYYVLEGEQNHADGTTVVVTSDAGEEELEQALQLIVDALGEDQQSTDDAAQGDSQNDEGQQDAGTSETRGDA